MTEAASSQLRAERLRVEVLEPVEELGRPVSLDDEVLLEHQLARAS